MQKHTAASIRWWSPTQLLIDRSEACLWQSGRDADYSSVCGRMYRVVFYLLLLRMLQRDEFKSVCQILHCAHKLVVQARCPKDMREA